MTLFNWLEEITVNKSHPDSFTDQDWDSFNSYMVHRFISMKTEYLDIANFVQKLDGQNKKLVYKVYKDFIPKNKVWLQYIKGSSEIKKNEILVEHLTKYFECSIKEAIEYSQILKRRQIISILESMGVDKRLIKKLKL